VSMCDRPAVYERREARKEEARRAVGRWMMVDERQGSQLGMNEGFQQHSMGW
jgi:hypothetical protein